VAFLLLALSLPLRILHKSWWGGWVRDILRNIVLQYTACVSATMSS
jgi:hypothetical protein